MGAALFREIMESDMQLKARLTELARIKGTTTPVVSVYLNTSWEDEHQRDRVRVFLKNEIRKARQGSGARCAESDLEWIAAQGEALVSQELFEAARGVALFACESAGLREVLPVRIPFENAFVVAEEPSLVPLTAALEEAPPSLLLFLDGAGARPGALGPRGAGGGGRSGGLGRDGSGQGWPRRGGPAADALRCEPRGGAASLRAQGLPG